jgi:hypothetical protein
MDEHENTDVETIEVMPAMPAAADPLGLLHSVLTMVNSARQCERRVKELQRETAIAEKAKAESAAGQTELAAARAAFDQHCASEDAALAARAEAVSKAEVELFGRENAVAAREDAAREVESAWRYVMESDYVQSGFQSAEFGPLEKAKRWIAGLPIVSTDGDAPEGAEIDTTSDTDPAARGNDPAFIETMPPGATLARAAQSPPRSAQARRAMRNAAEH